MHASQMDIFYGVENTSLYPRNIPDAPTFQMNARGSAVNNDNHVVIYEKTGKFGFFTGARAWWLFKVRMLLGYPFNSFYYYDFIRNSPYFLL